MHETFPVEQVDLARRLEYPVDKGANRLESVRGITDGCFGQTSVAIGVVVILPLVSIHVLMRHHRLVSVIGVTCDGRCQTR